MRTAKSCGSGTPTLVSSLREGAQATVAKSPAHRGEHEAAVQPSRGECRVIPAEPVVTNSCTLFFIVREAAGASSARHSLRPLLERAERKAWLAQKMHAARSRRCVQPSLRAQRSNPSSRC